MASFAVSEGRLKEIAAPYGGVEVLEKRMDEHSRALARLSQDWQMLKDRYPNCWVAVGPDGVIATAGSSEQLFADLRGREGGEYVVEFFDTSPGVLVL